MIKKTNNCSKAHSHTQLRPLIKKRKKIYVN